MPGGKAAYPSSVLMNAMPAKVAGVREIVMAVPTPGGERNELVLAAAAICGVDRVFTHRRRAGDRRARLRHGDGTGGGQDRRARATPTSPPPSAACSASSASTWSPGPSEIVVVCDGSTDPDWVAMDLFSQAEHDELAQAILLAPDAAFLDAVAASMERQLADDAAARR